MDASEYERMDALENHFWWYRALHTRLLDAIMPASGSLLDAGCGTGRLLQLLHASRADLRLVGIDWSTCAAWRATAKAAVPVVCGDVNAMPFVAKSFDLIVSADVLCHRAVDVSRALQQFFHLLRPGGRLIINMPAYQWLLSAHDRAVHNARRTTMRGLISALEAAGFKIIDANYWNALLLPAMIVARATRPRHNRPSSDLVRLPDWLNRVMFFVTEVERGLPIRWPAGGSIIAIAQRPA